MAANVPQDSDLELSSGVSTDTEEYEHSSCYTGSENSEDEAVAIPDDDGEWVEVADDFNGEPLPFAGAAGARNIPDDIEEPVDFFRLFFDGDFLQHIVTETNIYQEQEAEKRQQEGKVLKPQSRLRNWTPLTIHELEVFLALNLLQGLLRMPSVQDAWKGVKKYFPLLTAG